ncbi:hypothetical protein TUSST3_39770 [Streptomyces sp. TUS-ST3]|nr:hypothetical protein TUSST3_39770 [Streptomyces sp. TUS-ST3]
MLSLPDTILAHVADDDEEVDWSDRPKEYGTGTMPIGAGMIAGMAALRAPAFALPSLHAPDITQEDGRAGGAVRVGACGPALLRGPAGLGEDREGAQARLHRSDRRGRARAFVEFTDAWGGKYPAIVRLWEAAWAEFVSFLRFDVEIRKIVCTTNAIESINARIRKAVRARGHFPTSQAALKCVYLAVMSRDPTGTGRKCWTMRWKSALQAFDITFDGRLTAGRR